MSQAEIKRAKAEMRAHGSYTESEESIKSMIRAAGVFNVDRVFRALLLSGDIIHEFPGHVLGFEYTLKFIGAKDEEEE